MNKTKSEMLRVFHSKKETRIFYNRISHFYDLLADWSEESVRCIGIEMLKLRRGEKALEIGFGTGHSLVAIAESVGPEGRVYGVDISEEMVKTARENSIRQGVAYRLNLVCTDAAKLPFISNIVDAIFVSFALELFDTPEIPTVLSECMRVLNDNGRIVVIGMTKETNNGIALETLEWTHRHFPTVLDCRPIYVREALQDGGFQILDVKKRNMWVPVEIVLGRKIARKA